MQIQWILVLVAFLWFADASYAAALARVDPPPAQTVTLQSELPTGNPIIDTIEITYYPADRDAAPSGKSTQPAIVVLPPIGSDGHTMTMRKLGLFAASHGISAAILTLPYHGRRWPVATDGRVRDPAVFFLSGDPERSTQAFAQSASDVTTVVSWLQAQPGVDASRIGVVGASLGAIVAHLAMGRDDRIRVGVALLGAGDLADISLHSVSVKIVRFFHPAQRIPASVSPEQIERLMRRVDPITYADENRPRRVFMVEAARDLVVPPRDAEALWRALGKPPIRWVDTNHFAIEIAANAAFEAAFEYLNAAWALPRSDKSAVIPTPHLSLPVIKLGFIGQAHGPGSLGITPALTLQAASLGTYGSHLSVAHADIGIGGRGPFAAAALTLGAFFDVGYASRIVNKTAAPRPYLGVHFTF